MPDSTLSRSSRLDTLYVFLLGGAFPLFIGMLLSDIGYAQTHEIQWKNFSSWLIASGLVFAGFAFLCVAIELFRPSRRNFRNILSFFILIPTWILGFINALIHGEDAWGGMPTGITLSVIIVVLILVTALLCFFTPRTGANK